MIAQESTRQQAIERTRHRVQALEEWLSKHGNQFNHDEFQMGREERRAFHKACGGTGVNSRDFLACEKRVLQTLMEL